MQYYSALFLEDLFNFFDFLSALPLLPTPSAFLAFFFSALADFLAAFRSALASLSKPLAFPFFTSGLAASAYAELVEAEEAALVFSSA